MRSYLKVAGPNDQSVLTPDLVNPDDRYYWLKRGKKADVLTRFNFLSKPAQPTSQDGLVIWLAVDSVDQFQFYDWATTGNPANTGDYYKFPPLLAQFSGVQLANFVFPLHNYDSHPLD
jgi:hypothetical protein